MSGDARRWQMTDAPQLSPGADYFTRSTIGPFLDTGIEVNFGMKGHIYISLDTLREMALIAGLFAEKTPVETNLHERAIYNKGLEDGLKRGEEIRGQLRDLLDRLGGPAPAGAADGGTGGVPAVDAAPADVSGDEEPGGDGVAADDPAVGGGEAGGAADPADGVEGSDDVPGVGSDVDDAFRI